MYLNYFGLTEAPFSIAPDPRYLYMSQRHQEALAHLLYGLQGDGGFVVLTGEVGAGKTTVCRCLLEQIPDTCDVAYIFNPKLTAEELLAALCTEFRIDYPPGNTSIKVFIDCLNAYLLDAHARGRHSVLIIDEAQSVAGDVLEQMRLLTNLETSQRKLLQIVLLGQPELNQLLARPELRQLAQRIIARYHLGPLSRAEVGAYIRHRLDVSGIPAGTRQLFPDRLLGPIYRWTGGVPRLVNVLCDRALLGAFAQGKRRVDRTTLAQAAGEVFQQPTAGRRWRLILAVLLPVALAVAALWHANWPPLPVAESDGAAPPAMPGKPVEMVQLALAWPGDAPRADSQRLAMVALYRAWGIEYPGRDSCRELARLDLSCRAARGSIQELRQVNRPVVLAMRDRNRADPGFYATLLALDQRSATFAVGGKVITVALTALADQWSGNYFLLWRKPPHERLFVQRGESGPAVAWLDKQLALFEGTSPAIETNPLFDDVMVRRVRQFQLSQDIEPDGAVGPQTLIRLSGIGDGRAPTLAASEAKQHVLHP